MKHGKVDNGMYRKLTGASDATVTRDLDLLEKKGLIEQVGDGRWARYVLKRQIYGSFFEP